MHANKSYKSPSNLKNNSILSQQSMQDEPMVSEMGREETLMVEEELEKYLGADGLSQEEIEAIREVLRQRHEVDVSPDLLATMFRQLKERQTAMPPSVPTQPIFKQFQPTKPDEPRRIQPQPRPYTCRSKRKIRPTQPTPPKPIQQLVQHLDNSTHDCHILFQRKNRKNNAQKDVSGILQEQCQWAFNQWFYCGLDRGFLREDEGFRKVLEVLQINPEGMTFYDYKVVRLALPRPRIFNAEFIGSEIERLNEHRNQLRAFPKHGQRNKTQELSVGREVIAIHPVCGHLHSGTILAIYKQNQFMVKFSRPQLGTQKILDINITLKEVNHPHKIIIQNINFQAMALTIKLLDYKSELIRAMAKYNDVAMDAQKEGNTLDNRFYQQYGWIGSTINILTLGIKHILSKFRIRGLDQNNQEKIGKNFASVLINPLSLMQKELDKSSENSDINASLQIKRIVSTHKEPKVDQYTRELFTRHWNSLKNKEWSQDQRDQFQNLMRCLVGILVSLKIEHKHFSIQDNKYLKELMANFDNRFPQHFNEIYELLTSITAKIGEEQK